MVTETETEMEMKSAPSSSNPNRPNFRQLFLRIPDGSTISLLLPNTNVSISSLKHLLFRRTHVPPSSQLLSLCGRVLPDSYHAPIPPNSTISLSIRLCGGKGGFGSLLRGAATKAGQKKTSNFDACRDMSGRRLRHVNAEKKLEEWRAEEEERRLEKMAAEFLKQNAKKAEKMAGKSGNSATDKYVLKYREDSAKCVERVEECVKEVVGKRKIGKAIVPGVGDSKKLKIWMGKRKLEESDCGSDDDEDNERSVVSDGVPRPNSTGEPEGSPHSVTGGSQNQNGSALGSSGSSSEEERDAVSLETFDCRRCSRHQGILEKEEKNLDLEISNASEVYPVSEDKDYEPVAKSSGLCQLVDHDAGVIHPHGDANQITEAVQAVGEADSLSETRLGTLDEKPLVFNQYHSSSEMEALGMERLKMELQSRGLKCGGTLQERAARLFILKSLTLDHIPKKHLAKK